MRGCGLGDFRSDVVDGVGVKVGPPSSGGGNSVVYGPDIPSIAKLGVSNSAACTNKGSVGRNAVVSVLQGLTDVLVYSDV